jgi:hypothetical protein
MSPKGTFRQASEAILPQIIQNVGARTVYGDARTVTEDAMMVEHAKCLRLAGVIDDDMERALSQPRFDKARELKTKYTTEYLAMHPNYTGSNLDEIHSYEVALRRQKARDAAQKKLLSDYKLGKINEHGRPLYYCDNSCEDDEADENSDGRLTSLGSSEESDCSSPPQRVPMMKPTIQQHAGMARGNAVPRMQTTPITTSIDVAAPVDNLPASSRQMSTSSAPPVSVVNPPPRTSPSPAATPWRPRAAPKRGPCTKTTLAVPLPDQPDYANYTYYQVAALGRARHIPTGGNTQEIRNRLIRDDINMAQNKPRERSRYKSVGRTRGFKTIAPLEDAGGQGNEDGRDEGSVDDAEEDDISETEPVVRENGKENIAPGQGSEIEIDSDGEDVLQSSEGPRGVKRKGGADRDMQGSNGGSAAKKVKTTAAV